MLTQSKENRKQSEASKIPEAFAHCPTSKQDNSHISDGSRLLSSNILRLRFAQINHAIEWPLDGGILKRCINCWKIVLIILLWKTEIQNKEKLIGRDSCKHNFLR
ncbi:hypothetical protein LguiB_020680 [Lonicera macranthoides]